jgi:hypothetical protein
LNDPVHTELFRLRNNDLLVSLIKSYMDLTNAVRGAAFADPKNLEKSRTLRRIMIQLLSGSGQICVDRIQSTNDQYLAAIRGPEASMTRWGGIGGGRNAALGRAAPDSGKNTAIVTERPANRVQFP